MQKRLQNAQQPHCYMPLVKEMQPRTRNLRTRTIDATCLPNTKKNTKSLRPNIKARLGLHPRLLASLVLSTRPPDCWLAAWDFIYVEINSAFPEVLSMLTSAAAVPIWVSHPQCLSAHFALLLLSSIWRRPRRPSSWVWVWGWVWGISCTRCEIENMSKRFRFGG